MPNSAVAMTGFSNSGLVVDLAQTAFTQGCLNIYCERGLPSDGHTLRVDIVPIACYRNITCASLSEKYEMSTSVHTKRRKGPTK